MSHRETLRSSHLDSSSHGLAIFTCKRLSKLLRGVWLGRCSSKTLLMSVWVAGVSVYGWVRDSTMWVGGLLESEVIPSWLPKDVVCFQKAKYMTSHNTHPTDVMRPFVAWRADWQSQETPPPQPAEFLNLNIIHFYQLLNFLLKSPPLPFALLSTLNLQVPFSLHSHDFLAHRPHRIPNCCFNCHVKPIVLFAQLKPGPPMVETLFS